MFQLVKCSENVSEFRTKQDQRPRDSNPKFKSCIAVKAKNIEIDKLTLVLFNRLILKCLTSMIQIKLENRLIAVNCCLSCQLRAKFQTQPRMLKFKSQLDLEPLIKLADWPSRDTLKHFRVMRCPDPKFAK